MQVSEYLHDNTLIFENSLWSSCCGHTLYNEIQQHSGSGNIHLTPRLHGDNKRAIEAIIVVLYFDRSQTFLPIWYETFFMLTTSNMVTMQNFMRQYLRNLCNYAQKRSIVITTLYL